MEPYVANSTAWFWQVYVIVSAVSLLDICSVLWLVFELLNLFFALSGSPCQLQQHSNGPGILQISRMCFCPLAVAIHPIISHTSSPYLHTNTSGQTNWSAERFFDRRCHQSAFDGLGVSLQRCWGWDGPSLAHRIQLCFHLSLRWYLRWNSWHSWNSFVMDHSLQHPTGVSVETRVTLSCRLGKDGNDKDVGLIFFSMIVGNRPTFQAILTATLM